MPMRRIMLIDCNPKWCTWSSGPDGSEVADALQFDCPEGHAACHHIIPFTPAMDGSPRPSPQKNGAQWTRTGGDFATLTIMPSIKRIPRHASREAAIAAGCIPEHITESLLCAFHAHIVNGAIVFCDDSK